MLTNYSEACERNKDPILEVLKTHLTNPAHVLEIGSGTGQHAVFFSEHLKHLTWQPTDLPENVPGIRNRIDQFPQSNLKQVLELDVTQDNWIGEKVDVVFTANTFHIMSWVNVQAFFKGVDKILNTGGILCVYGPFKYEHQYTSQSNAQFDQFLQQRDPLSGIREFEDINQIALDIDLELIKDYKMPANNQMIVWQRNSN